MAMTLLQMKTLFPDATRQGVVDIMYRQQPGLFERLNFISGFNSLAYPYNTETSLPGVAYRALNEEFAATAEGVVVPTVETLAILGGDITTDSVVISQKGLGPARTQRLAKKAKAIARRFVKDFFVGSRATNPKSFDGLLYKLGSSRVVTNATNGAVPKWKKFVELQDLVEGDNAGKILCINTTTRRLLSEDVSANAGGMGVFDVGKQLQTFNGSPIVEISKDDTEAEILTFGETCGTSSVTASAYCLRLGSDIDEEYVQGLSGLAENISFIDVGYTGATYKDVCQMAAGVGLFSGYCAARIKGLLAS